MLQYEDINRLSAVILLPVARSQKGNQIRLVVFVKVKLKSVYFVASNLMGTLGKQVVCDLCLGSKIKEHIVIEYL